jgi:hypothetical protein
MKEYNATSLIKASPETIWSILTDAPSYPSWNASIDRVEGTIAPGSTVKVFIKLNPGRAFPVKVTEFEPGKKMAWSGGMPLGLFKGVRTYTISPEGYDMTRVTMHEEYTGPLLGMIWKSMPDLTPTFEQWATGLKSEAESRG